MVTSGKWGGSESEAGVGECGRKVTQRDPNWPLLFCSVVLLAGVAGRGISSVLSYIPASA